MTAIIDYGVGNLFSVEKAFSAMDENVVLTSDLNEIENADKLILPGVGAFGDCMKNLEERKFIPLILNHIEKNKPLLGICVGLQLLFEGSEESPNVKGLGVFKGTVKKINAPNLKIPHMGWNSVSIRNSELKNCNLFEGLKKDSYFYFVHSYHAVPEDENIIIATTQYGEKLTAAIANKNVYATQFHPEKSGDVGLELLKNFSKIH